MTNYICGYWLIGVYFARGRWRHGWVQKTCRYWRPGEHISECCWPLNLGVPK